MNVSDALVSLTRSVIVAGGRAAKTVKVDAAQVTLAVCAFSKGDVAYDQFDRRLGFVLRIDRRTTPKTNAELDQILVQCASFLDCLFLRQVLPSHWGLTCPETPHTDVKTYRVATWSAGPRLMFGRKS